eukprot:1144011-Amorphochlora_amoeboformis.AAC.2
MQAAAHSRMMTGAPRVVNQPKIYQKKKKRRLNNLRPEVESISQGSIIIAVTQSWCDVWRLLFLQNELKNSWIILRPAETRFHHPGDIIH